MRTSLLLASMVFLGLLTTSAQAGTVAIQYGWGSEIRTVGNVAKDSPLGREMGDQRLSIAQTWDQFWLGAPMWCSGRRYLVHERAAVVTAETKVWELQAQSPDEIARLTNIPRSQLSFPWWSYVPSGWLIAAGLVLVVRFLTGASPKKRFERLWKDERYRQAVTILSTPIDVGDDEPELTAEEVEAEAEANWNEALAYLAAQGISSLTAQRNLHFLAGYLRNHAVG